MITSYQRKLCYRSVVYTNTFHTCRDNITIPISISFLELPSYLLGHLTTFKAICYMFSLYSNIMLHPYVAMHSKQQNSMRFLRLIVGLLNNQEHNGSRDRLRWNNTNQPYFTFILCACNPILIIFLFHNWRAYTLMSICEFQTVHVAVKIEKQFLGYTSSDTDSKCSFHRSTASDRTSNKPQNRSRSQTVPL